MIRWTLKKYIAELIILAMLFFCLNINVYAENSQKQKPEGNRLALDMVYNRSGIDPEIYAREASKEREMLNNLSKDSPYYEEIKKRVDLKEKRAEMLSGKMTMEEFKKYSIEHGLTIGSNVAEIKKNNKVESPSTPDTKEQLSEEEIIRRYEISGKKMDMKIKRDGHILRDGVEQSKTIAENIQVNPNAETDRFIVKYKNKLPDTETDENKKGTKKENKRTDKKGLYGKKIKDTLKTDIRDTKGLTSKNRNNENLEIIITNTKVAPHKFIDKVKRLDTEQEIEYIQPDYEVSAFETTETDSLNSSNFLLIDNDYHSAWSKSQGDGVIVAVLDTCIDINHTKLKSNIFANKSEIAGNGIDDDENGYIDDISGWNFFEKTPQIFNDSNAADANHGTHVAGIIAGSDTGVAPKAVILPLVVFEDGKAFTSDIIEAIEYAEEMGAKLVNCSWGCSSENPALKEAIQQSQMLFVCAAGNNAANMDVSPIYPASYGFNNVISVAAMNKQFSLASFSNYGENSVSVAAIGDDVKSTLPNNSVGVKSGTSQAAAYVSGQCALIISKFSSLSASEVKNRVKDTSDRLSTLVGRINEANSINYVNSLSNTYNSSNRNIIQIQGTQTTNDSTVQQNANIDWSLYSVEKSSKISAKGDQSLCLKEDGTVWQWGSDIYNEPTKVEGIDNIISVSAGASHNLALKSDGTVYAWGANSYGQLGTGNTNSSSIPVQISILSSIISISAGSGYSLALKSDGSVYAWGSIKTGTELENSSPTQVSSLLGIIAISAGYNNDCLLLKSNGTVCVWNGGNTAPINKSSLTNVIAISAGYRYYLALKSDGTVYSWGCNDYGQLGNGTTSSNYSSTPVKINSLEGIKEISAGCSHSFAIKSDETVYAWGNNEDGQLGIKTENYYINSPMLVNSITGLESISAGKNHSIALKANGTIFTVGYNFYSSYYENGIYVDKVFTLINEFSNLDIASISNGGSSLALTYNGDVYELKHNSTIKQVNDLTGVVSISAGGSHNLALTGSGIVYAWGGNSNKQLGAGCTETYSSIPVQVQGLTGIKAISAGSGFSLALTNDGLVCAWGSNYSGQLGPNCTATNSSVPVKVEGLTGIKAISAGSDFSLALTNDGLVYAWGNNDHKQLGAGCTATNSSTPVQVQGLTGIKNISAGYIHCLALTNGGIVYTWGNNISDMFMNNDIPVQLTSVTGVKDITSSWWFSYLLTNSGDIYAWGYDDDASYSGTARGASYPVPYHIEELDNVKSIDVGWNSSLALTENGEVYISKRYRDIGSWRRMFSTEAGPIKIVCSKNEYFTDSTFSVLLDGNGYVYVDGVQASDLDNIVDITASRNTVYALDLYGNVYKSDYYKEANFNTYYMEPAFAKVGGLQNITAISAGELHCLALTCEGTVYAWGDNSYGQLGFNGNTDTPTMIPNLSGIINIAAGHFHSLVLSSNGQVFLLGYSEPLLSGVKEISAGYNYNLALTSDGKLYSWGENIYGELGIGTEIIDIYTPHLILTDVKAISAGYKHSLALKCNGDVYAWGQNWYGQLGIGNNLDSFSPVQVKKNANDYFKNIKYINAGFGTSFAIDSSGLVFGWGDNSGNAMADGTEIVTANPINILGDTLKVSVGYSYSIALKRNGTVFTWGYNYCGRLGNGTTTSYYIPTEVPNLSGVKDISAGISHSLALKDDGTVYAWGNNNYGQLGNTNAGTSSNIPVQVLNLTNIKAISAGGSHSLALKDDGTVYAWGNNSYEQLGNTNGGTSSNIPVQVLNLTDIKAISAGNNHSLVLKEDGTVYVWGDNSYGQLGNFNMSTSSIPVQVFNLTNIKAISSGNSHCLALTEDGTVYAWGNNWYGQIGDGTSFTEACSPVQLTILSDIIAISSGADYCICLKQDGTIYSWGANLYGQLGIKNQHCFTTPTETLTLPGVKSVSAGSAHNLALKDDGSVYAWGSNASSEFGDGLRISGSVYPIEVYKTITMQKDEYSGNRGNAVSIYIMNKNIGRISGADDEDWFEFIPCSSGGYQFNIDLPSMICMDIYAGDDTLPRYSITQTKEVLLSNDSKYLIKVHSSEECNYEFRIIPKILDIEVANVVFKKGIMEQATAINHLETGYITGSVEVINGSKKEQTAVLIMQLIKTQDNSCSNISVAQINIPIGAKQTFSGGFNVDSSTGYRIEIRIWDSLESMKQLSKTIMFN